MGNVEDYLAERKAKKKRSEYAEKYGTTDRAAEYLEQRKAKRLSSADGAEQSAFEWQSKYYGAVKDAESGGFAGYRDRLGDTDAAAKEYAAATDALRKYQSSYEPEEYFDYAASLYNLYRGIGDARNYGPAAKYNAAGAQVSDQDTYGEFSQDKDASAQQIKDYDDYITEVAHGFSKGLYTRKQYEQMIKTGTKSYKSAQGIQDKYSPYPTMEDYANALDAQRDEAQQGILSADDAIAQADEAERNAKLNPTKYPSLFTVKATSFNRDAYGKLLENPDLDEAARKRLELYAALPGFAGYEGKVNEPETAVPQKNAELDGAIMWVLGLNGQRDYYDDGVRFGLRDVMTAREVQDFNAVYNTQGRDDAIQYISDIMPDLMEVYNRTGTVQQKNAPDYQAQRDTAKEQRAQYEDQDKAARMAKYAERPYWPGFYETSQPQEGEEGELLAQVLISTSRILDAKNLTEGFVDRDVLAMMSDGEKGTYYDIKHREGKDAAIQYLDDMADTLGERFTKARMAESEELAGQYPVYASAKSVLQNIQGAASGGLVIANTLLTGELLTPYSPGLSPLLEAEAARGAVSANMPVIGQKAYNIGMSVADSAAAAVFGPGLASAIMGTRAAANTMQDASERELTYNQAVTLSIVNGLAEVLTERVEFGRMFNMLGAGVGAKAAVQQVLKNALSEFGEESLTEFIDIMADKMVAEDKSIWQTKLDAYQAEGLDATTAQNRVIGDFIAQIGEAGVAGFVSGGFLSGITASIDAYSQTSETGAAMNDPESIAAMLKDASAFPADSKAYKSAQKITQRQQSGKEVSDRALGKQFNSNVKAFEASTASAITQRLQGQENAKALTDALVRATQGKKLGDAYAALVAENAEARALLAELSNTDVSEGVTPKQVQAIAQRAAGGQIAPVAVTQAQEAATAAQPAQTVAQPAQAVKTPFTGFSGGAKTIDATQEDGTPVVVTGISSTDGDTVYVTLDNGGVADAASLSFANEDTGALYSFAAEYDAQTAGAFVYGFSGNTPLSDYAEGFKRMYRLGKVNMSFANAFKQVAPNMTEAEAMAAHSAGVTAAGGKVAKPQAATQEAANEQEAAAEPEPKAEDKPAEKKYKPGLVRSFNPKTAKLSEASKVQLSVIDALAKRAGIAVVVSDKLPAGINGEFSRSANQLTISLNAVDGGYLYVAVHELTHYIQNNNAVEYEVLRDFIIQKLQEQPGYDLEARIKEVHDLYLAKVDQDLSRDRVIDELVADGAASILTDEQSVRDLVKRNKSLAKKIADFFKDFYEELRAIVMRISERGHPESEVLARDVAAVREIYVTWMIALDNAVFDANVSAEVAVAEDVDTESDTDTDMDSEGDAAEVAAADDAQYSVQTDSEGRELSEEQARFFRASKVRDADGRLLKMYHGTDAYKEFTVFKKGKSGWLGGGIYLTSRRAYAEKYATDSGYEGRVYETYVDIKNPLVVTSGNPPEEILRAIYGNERVYANRSSNQSMATMLITSADIKKLQAKGYDGIVWRFAKDVEVSAFDPNQIKRVDNLTPTNSPDIRYSLDAEYMSAVESGDMDAAQRMVDEAAKAAGYTVKAYHGTGAKFNSFKKGDIGFHFGTMAQAKQRSGVWGKSALVGGYWLRIKNPLVVNHDFGSWDGEYVARNIAVYGIESDAFISGPSDKEKLLGITQMYGGGFNSPASKAMREFIQSKGHDGVKYRNSFEGKKPGWSYIAFDPRQAKSADPVTYDASGNVIPLSQRFSASSPDIRYSLQGNTALSNPKLVAENKNLRQAVKLLEQQFKLTRGRTVTEASVNSMAKRIVSDYGSSVEPDVLAANIRAIADYAQGDTPKDWQDVMTATAEVARSVIETSKQLDNTTAELFADLSGYLRDTKIALSDDQKAAVAEQYGSYDAFRRSTKAAFSDKGTALDDLWADMAERWPNFFDATTDSASRPEAIVAALEAMQPKYINPFGMNMDQASSDLAMRIYNEYFALPAGTFADEMDSARKAEVAQLRAEYDANMKQFRADSKAEYDARLKALKAEEAAKRKAISDQFKEAADEATKTKLREQYRRLTDKRNADVAAKMAYYQAKQKTDAAKRKESATARKYRTRIEATAREMYAYMNRPSDKKHVPSFMQGPLLSILEMLDFGRVVKSGPRAGMDTKKGAQWAEAVTALRDQLRNYEAAHAGVASKDAAMYLKEYMTIDPDLVPTLNDLVDSLTKSGTATVSGMNAKQLADFENALSAVWHAVKSINRTWANAKYRRMSELGDATNGYLQKLREKRLGDRGPLAVIDGLLNYDQLDSYSFGERLGDAGASVIGAIDAGLNKTWSRIREAADHNAAMFKGLRITGKEINAWTQDANDVSLESGKNVKLSTAQKMEIYALSNRPQGMTHLLGGGIRIETINRGVGKGEIRQVARFSLTSGDIAAIAASLTPIQRGVTDAMQSYLSTDAAAWGNETSMLLYLYEKYKEPKYWPIRSYQNVMRTKELNQAQVHGMIRNSGFTKATVPNASNPILIGDVFSTYAGHITEMATYNGLAAPIEDAMKWYNYVERIENDDGTTMPGDSVKESMERALGVRSMAFFEKLLDDINGTSTGKYDAEISNSLLGLAKGAMVAWRIRVVVQQPTALMRATAMISPKYLAAAPIRAHSIAEMRKYAPVAWWKAQGGYDTGLGRNMKNVLLGTQTFTDKYNEAAFWLAARADDTTWSRLWEAVKLETAHENPGMNKASDEFMEKVTARFTDIINRTQVVDSVMHRSQIMRSKNGLAKVATMFMAEPTKTYNMARSALSQVRNGNSRSARRRLARSVASLAVNSLLLSAVLSAFDGWRKRKDDETFWESFIQQFTGWDRESTFEDYLKNPTKWTGNLLDELTPLRLVPYGRDLLTLMQGFDLDRSDLALLEEIYTAVENAGKYMDGTSKMTGYAVATGLAKSLSPLIKMPVGGLIQNFEDVVNGLFPGTIQAKRDTATETSTMQKLYDKVLAGDKEAIKQMRADMRTLSKNAGWAAERKNVYGFGLKSDAEIDRGIAAVLATQDARIADAYAARKTLNTTKLKSIRSAIIKDGFTGEMVDVAINYYQNNEDTIKAEVLYEDPRIAQAFNAKDAGDTKKLESIQSSIMKTGYSREAVAKAVSMYADRVGNKQLDEKLYDTEDLFAAVRSGKASAITDVYNELVADSSSSDPEAAIMSSITSEFKPEYVALYQAGDRAKMDALGNQLMSTFGYTEVKLQEWLREGNYDGLEEAVTARDITAAQKYITQAKQDSGRKEYMIASSLSSRFKQQYIDLYASGNIFEANNLADFLMSLNLRNSSGNRSFTNKTFQAWLDPND